MGRFVSQEIKVIYEISPGRFLHCMCGLIDIARWLIAKYVYAYKRGNNVFALAIR